MNTVEIDKEQLAEVLKANLSKHKETYDKAVVEYRAQQHQLLEDLLKRAEKGREIDRLALSRMRVPENHAEDYQVVLEMLEFEVNDTIELSYADFRRYVRDEWEWRQAFLQNTASYVAS